MSIGIVLGKYWATKKALVFSGLLGGFYYSAFLGCVYYSGSFGMAPEEYG